MTYQGSAPQGTPASVLQRGQAIDTWLGQLLVVYIVLTVIMALAMLGMLLLGGSMLRELGGGPALISLTYLPGLIGGVLYIYAIRAARPAVLGVRYFAGQGQALGSLREDIARFQTWLTVGQAWAVVSALLSMAAGFTLARLMPGMDTGLPAGQSGAVPTALLAAVVAALNWWILAAVKKFFGAVLVRAEGQGVAVTRPALAAASWMQFIYILQWIGVAVAASGILFGVLGGVVALSREGGGVAVVALVIMVPFVAFVAWAMSLTLRLTGHSVLFATEVGKVLDSSGGLPAQVQLAPDPWNDAGRP